MRASPPKRSRFASWGLCRPVWLTLIASGTFSPARGDTPAALVLWHNLEIGQASILQQLAEPVVRDAGYTLQLETGFDLSPALARLKNRPKPDILLAPADLASLNGEMNFSPISLALRDPGIPSDIWKAVTVSGHVVAIPVFIGNHLMLFYNKKMVESPPHSFDTFLNTDSKSPQRLFAWNYREPYFIFPFLGAVADDPAVKSSQTGPCPFSEKAVAQTFEMYRQFAIKKLVPINCDYNCMTTGFYRGVFPYSISGDWALEEARRQLGNNLGVAPIPMLHGRKIRPYYMPTALFFPKNSLAGPKSKVLTALAHAIAGREAQRVWLSKGRRLPANRAVIQQAGALDSEELRDSYRMLRSARPFPRLPNSWFWPALRRSFELFLDSGRSADEAARLVAEVCAVKATDEQETPP